MAPIEEALVSRFRDAARYCELRVLANPVASTSEYEITASLAAGLGDASLEDYANNRPATIQDGPHGGATASSISYDNDPESNGCMYGTSVTDGDGVHPHKHELKDGFCRADFNFCLGRELEAHAVYLPSGSADAPLRAELLRVARERLQAASAEYLSSVAFNERACVSEPDAPFVGTNEHTFECQYRLFPDPGEGYLPTVRSRLLESIERVVALAGAEAELRVDIGDRRAGSGITRGRARLAALYGAQGSRTRARETYYGPSNGVDFSAAPVELEDRVSAWAAEAYRPMVVPSVAPGDDHALRGLALLQEFQIPLRLRRDSDTTPPTLGGDLSVSTIYELLERRVRAVRHLPPYDDSLPADPATDDGAILRSGRPLTSTEVAGLAMPSLAGDEGDWVVRADLGVTQADIGAALDLVEDVYRTQLGQYEFAVQVHEGAPGGEPTGQRYLALTHSAPQSSPAAILAALSSEVPGVTLADATIPELLPAAKDGTSTSGNFYEWSFDRLDASRGARVAPEQQADFGASAALHFLRVHLMRIRQVRLETSGPELLDETTITESLALIADAVGQGWTEHDSGLDAACKVPLCDTSLPGCPPVREEQALYGPCSTCNCELEPAQGGRVWSTHDTFDLSSPVVAFHREELRCALGANSCATPLTSLSVVEGSSTTRLGFTRTVYQLPPAPTEATHYFILGQTPEGGYELWDVVPVASPAGVHPVGGAMLEAAASIAARDPWRPDRPSSAARGEPLEWVPPLESELISDGDAYEDSFAHYLEEATMAVSRARTRLTEARDAELLARLEERSTEAVLAEAALFETETLSDLCGDVPGCQVDRAGPTTLGELGLVPPPPPAPDLTDTPYDGGTCRDVEAGLFEDFHDRVSAGFANDDAARTFSSEHLGRVLQCSVHRYLSDLHRLTLDDLPQAVVDALAGTADPIFASFSGQLREVLISIFSALDQVRVAVRRFSVQRFAAERLVEAASQSLSYANVTEFEKQICQARTALGIISSVASLASSAVSFGGAVGSGRSLGGRNSNRARADAGRTERDAWSGSLRATGNGLQAGSGLMGQLHAGSRSDWCNSQAAAEGAAHSAATELNGVLLGMASLGQQALDGARGGYFLLSQLDRMEEQAEFASQRRQVAGLLAASDRVSDLPEWHAMRGFNHRRAQAALNRAQMAVFVARRAMEYRLGIDLATMYGPEALTPPPATWSESLFDTGAAVIAVPDSEEQVAVAAEELDLYLSRLRRFLHGYPITRRFRDASDLQVLDLASVLRASEGAPIIEHMMFTCSDDPAAPLLGGHAAGSSDAPCTGRGVVVSAEVEFELPAELADYIADRLSEGSFNYRHERLAVNFVGTGVLDCEQALDRRECYSDGNVFYGLRHEGPFVIENFDRELQTFSVEPGVVEAGRALVRERSLTTPMSSVDRGQIEPFLRQELRGRPLSGHYRLIIPGRPEINWQNLERVQLLLGYRYWTRQE